MKYFAIHCLDKAGAGQARKDSHAEHLAYIETVMDHIAVAGPMRDSDGGNIGSLLVVKAESAQAARAQLEGDPYFAAGIFETITITDFLPVVGDWIGGKKW